MKWLKEVLLEAASQNKVLLSIAAGAFVVLGAADTVLNFVQERISDWITLPRGQSVTIFGVPSWFLGIILALFLIVIWLLRYASGLRKRLTPKIDVQFEPEGQGILLSPTQVYETNASGKVANIREDEAVYVSITLRTLSETTIRNCVAFLTKIERRLLPTGPFVDIPVYSLIPLLPSPIDLHPRIPVPVSFLKAGRSDKKLEFSMSGWPLRLRGVFDQHATYRCTIEVNGDGVTKTIQVDVDWAGHWDAITARRSASSTL